MKRHNIFAFFLIFFLTFTPVSTIFAQTKVKPDIRTSDIFVKTRPMPSQDCKGKTVEEWINEYVGFNKIKDEKLKFYSDLVPDAEQLKSGIDLLLPYSLNPTNTWDEKGNKNCVNARVCAYQGLTLITPPPSKELICAEKSIDYGTKLQYWDWDIFSAIVANGHIACPNGVCNMQRPDIAPNTQNPLPCSATPPGVPQSDKIDENSGANPFFCLWCFIKDQVMNAVCADNPFDPNPCDCVDTRMFIEPDSTIPYGSYTKCNATGCKNEQGVQEEVLAIDPAHRADVVSQMSGGAVNAFVPSLFQLFEYVKTALGSPMGIVNAQATTNGQGDRSTQFSWSFTKDWEIGWDFLICKVSPYNTREIHSQLFCYTNWIGNYIAALAGQIQGTATQNVAEPIEATSPANPVQ
jgi:hypothetical protein